MNSQPQIPTVNIDPIPKDIIDRVKMRKAVMGNYLVTPAQYGPSIQDHVSAGVTGAAVGLGTLCLVKVVSSVTGAEPSANWYIGLPLTLGGLALAGMEYICNDLARDDAALEEAKKQLAETDLKIETLTKVFEEIEATKQAPSVETLRESGLKKENVELCAQAFSDLLTIEAEAKEAHNVLARYGRGAQKEVGFILDQVQAGKKEQYCKRSGSFSSSQRAEMYEAGEIIFSAKTRCDEIWQSFEDEIKPAFEQLAIKKATLDRDVELLGKVPSK